MQLEEIQGSGSIAMPRILSAWRIDDLFNLTQRIRQQEGPIVLDGRDVEFVDPLGIAVLGATLEPLSATRSIEIEWLPTDVGGYLGRMDFLSRCNITGVESGGGRRDRSDALVELTKLTQEHEVDEAAARLTHALAGHLTKADPDAPRDESSGFNEYLSYQHPLQYSISELLLNALSHAKREGCGQAAVWLAAQFYPKKGTVHMAVVDNGCGMLATLQHHAKLYEKSHAAAIPAALTPWISCNTDVALRRETTNRGVGLTTTNNISKAAGGGLTIATGNAYASTNGGLRSNLMSEGASWQGVAIALQCRRHMLPSIKVPKLLPVVENSPQVGLRFTP
jgi:anti-sigma regulatory factor (Ser/Thr protein kinase)